MLHSAWLRAAGGTLATIVSASLLPAAVNASPNAQTPASLVAGSVDLTMTASPAASNYELPSSLCYRPRRIGPVTNFYRVEPRWRHCPWLVVPANEALYCPRYSNRCPAMWDVRWRRWNHQRAVGIGWVIQPNRPTVKWRAKVVFSKPVLGYTKHGRSWRYSRSHLRKLGPARPRTLLERPTTYLLGQSGSGRTHCTSLFPYPIPA